ncbi:MAG: flagellar filament capping protein FliD [Idiomarina sp.]
MAISALGVGSGLALDDLVKQLVQIERQPKEESLKRRETEAQVSLSAFSKLKSTLSTFRTSITDLKDSSTLQARSAEITGQDSDNPFLSATASSSAPKASYQISVEQLAQGSKAKSGAFTGSDQVVSTTAGNLTFATADGESSFSVAVGADATLADIANAVNKNVDNFGVSASIINTGGDNPETRLVFSSAETGAAKQLSVTNDNAELDSVSTAANAGGAGGMTIAVEDAARDAIMDIDGIRTYSASNTFDNAIEGVTLDAEKAAPGETVTLKVDTDVAGVREKIEGFMSNYNKVVDEINRATRTSAEEEGRGPLVGDSLIRGLQSSLTNIVGGAVDSGEGAMKTLYALGVTFNDDGKLEISSEAGAGGTGEERLTEALETNFDQVANLFSADDGIATKLDSLVAQYAQTGGLISGKEQVFKSRQENLTTEREQFVRYMESYEETLRARYTALDGVLAELNSTSSYLSSQLASLPGFGTN